MVDFSPETMKAREQATTIFQVLKKVRISKADFYVQGKYPSKAKTN